MSGLFSLEPVLFCCATCNREEQGEQLGLWYRLPASWLALLSEGEVVWTCRIECARNWVFSPVCPSCGGRYGHADTCQVRR